MLSSGIGRSLAVIACLLFLLAGCQDQADDNRTATPKAPPAPQAALKPGPGQEALIPEGQALELLRFGPSGQVRKLNQVVAMFNQPMAALGDYRNVPAGVLTIEPPLEGETIWLNQYSLAFIPKAPLTGSLAAKIRLNPAGLTALSGARLAAAGAEIEISLPDLEVASAYQTNTDPKDEDQALRPRWQVYFNQPPDLADLAAKSAFVFETGGSFKSVPALVELKEEYDSQAYFFTARERLPRNTDYRLVIAGGLKSLAGPRPAPELTPGQGRTYGPLTVSFGHSGDEPLAPAYGLSLNFSNPVDLAKIVPLLKIDNGFDLEPLKKRYAESGVAEEYEAPANLRDYLYIYGFKANSEYNLTLDGRARDIYGQPLGQSWSASFKTGPYETSLELGDDYGLVETASEPVLRLLASNIKEAKVEGYALTAEQAVKFLAAADFSPGQSWKIREAETALRGIKPTRVVTLPVPEGAVNGQVALPLDLKEMFGDEFQGRFLYLRSTWARPGQADQTRGHTYTMVQVSDLGLAIKAGSASSLIWTTNLARGQSWAGVELELLDPAGRRLWSGRSDAQGLATLPGAAEILKELADQDPSLFVVARAAGQMVLWNVNWDDGLENWRWNLDYGSALSREETNTNWLLSALPLYKPGETAKFKIIARQGQDDQLKDLTDQKLRVEVRDGQDQLVDSALLEVSPFGTVSHQVAIPADASLGYWSVRAGRDGSDSLAQAGSFRVLTYRAPAFEIKVEGQPDNAVLGDPVELKARADYHFGAPVSGQPAKYTVTTQPAYFSLPGDWAAYSVLNQFSPVSEDDPSDGDDYSEPTVTVAEDETRLDQDGRLTLPLSLAPALNQRPAPRTYEAYFTVTDVDQRQVSTHTSFLVHPASLYAGLYRDNYVTEAGRPYKIKALAADPQGRLRPGRALKATLYRRVWQNVRRKTAGAAYEYISRMVDEKIAGQELTSGPLPVDIEFTPEKPGYYWVLAEIKDDQGRINQAASDFYVSGGGAVGWHLDDDDHLTLAPDKGEYKPGETARILVQSPFDQGEGLLTVERAGVRQSRVFKIESQTPVLEVALTEDEAPNVFVSVLLSRGRIADKLDETGQDFGKPAIRLGYTELKVPSKKNLLNVSVTPSLAEVGPGGEVEVTVAVTGSQGQPVREAEVALVAADAAVIQLGGDGAYHPESLYHQAQPLLVQTADNLFSLIGRQSLGRKGGHPGGGGGELAASDLDLVRRFFTALAFYDPQVNLDDQGRAKVKIKMPENLTTFKIYAVATGHGRLTGTGQNAVLVTRDLLARSALPGYAGVGDEFGAAMVVSNRGKNQGQATVTLAGQNFTLLEPETSKTVPLGPGESREVIFRVRAGTEPEAKFLFTVALGQDRDQVEFAIPVSPPNRLTTQASYEQIDSGQWQTDLALPPGADLSRGGLELELSPSLVGVFSEPFDWLLAYPHGCVEQSTSRGYGNLLWLTLKDRLKSDEKRAARARLQVETLLTKLNSWEYSGGYNMWPETYDYSHRSVYLSAYVLDFLLSAQEAGFKLPDPTLINRISEFLKSALSDSYQYWPAWYSPKAIGETKSYALAILSRAGQNVAAYTELQYGRRRDLNLFELVNLIRAIHFQAEGRGQDIRLKTLLPLLDKYLQITAGEAQLVEPETGAPEIWSSSVRTSALTLQALSEAAPSHDLLPALVRWLVSASRAGHFGTTQNNATALAALAQYIKVAEPEAPALTIAALLGQTTLARADFKSFTDPAVTGSAPLTAVPATPAVVYSLKGRGQAWAALKIKSAPVEPDLTPATSGGFMLSRAFTVVSPKGETPGVDHFRRGEVVRVSVTMMVPAPRHNLVLTDRVPAGFEPINFNLADADLTLLGLVNSEDDDHGRRYWYNHQEIWPDRVAVYADHLDAGVYTYSYLARAVTGGTYLTPGPQAEEMYAPENYGRGAGQRLVVE
ncbi:MAG: hypothetical protein LBP55_05305 [Candidatus Adiutrix sp.]|jgi:uncharacterized protein YfaS (alpha-2-macroglobulin family)|nr:hypothetical protein [Candidatus Adiutrix sp.]